ncbi:MAG: cation transporter [Planctomycetes bacterium]|nr:cation transporter [Planctomycetota bacterium]
MTLAVVVAALLAVAKFALGLFTGSLIVLASAADSFADALMSGVNLWGYRHARSPADEGHPYGHGKIEGVLAAAQGMLLVGVVGSLVAACVVALLQGERPAPRVPAAVVTVVVSGLVSLGLSWVLTHTPEEGLSAVVESDAAHYRVDFLTALAGVAGLGLVALTGLAWIDPLASVAMALLMGLEAAHVLRRSAAELLDQALPDEELAALQGVLEVNSERVLAFHGLRTRRSGPLRFVEVHAVLPAELALGAAHELVESVGAQLRAALPNCRVLVHPDAKGHPDSVDLPLE